jgi:hypothetical protein
LSIQLHIPISSCLGEDNFADVGLPLNSFRPTAHHFVPNALAALDAARTAFFLLAMGEVMHDEIPRLQNGWKLHFILGVKHLQFLFIFVHLFVEELKIIARFMDIFFIFIH